MSLTTRKAQAVATTAAARERARQATRQFAPVAKSARANAARQISGARGWAAPRVEQAAKTVQESVAPKVSAALAATARRIEPTPAAKLSRRARRWQARASARKVSAPKRMLGKVTVKAAKPTRRWPKALGGLAVAATMAGAVTAAVMWRNGKSAQSAAETAQDPAVSGEPTLAPADTSGVDGQVRTS